MSVIKSSNEDMVINADGVGSVIEFQENGVTVATSKGIVSNVKEYGATGDGVTDDTVAMQAAFDAGVGLIPPGEYLVGALTVASPIDIIGSGATLLCSSDSINVITVDSNDVSISGLIFSGNGHYVYTSLVYISGGSTGVSVKDCVFKDLVGVGTTPQYGIMITNGLSNVVVDGCEFKDITNDNTAGTTTSAFCGGVYVHSDSTDYGDVTVRNCTFNNIWTGSTGGNSALSDADGIRIYSSTAHVKSNTVISSCKFIDVQKSAIKSSGLAGTKISDIYIDNNRSDCSMVAGIRMQGSSYTQVSGINLSGNMARCLYVSAYDIDISDVKYTHRSSASSSLVFLEIASLSDGVADTNNITVSNVSAEQVLYAVNTVDNYAQGQFQFINNLKLDNWTITPKEAIDSPHFFKISNVYGLDISNINIDYSNGLISHGYYFVDCDSISIKDCKGLFRRLSVVTISSDIVATGNDLSIVDCEFIRPTSGGDLDEEMVLLQGAKNTFINGLTLSTPTYDTDTLKAILSSNNSHSSFYNIKIDSRIDGNGGKTYYATRIAGSYNTIAGLNLYVNDATIIGSSMYALSIIGSDHTVVSNVCSNVRGVDAASGDNITITGVSAENQSVLTGATNLNVVNAVDWV